MNWTKRVLSVASHFELGGTPIGVRELTEGNINMTYRVEIDAPVSTHYVLQRLNTAAFRNPTALMENVGMVTEHICRSYEAEGVDPTRRVLHFIKADNGTWLHTDSYGGCWRAYSYVDGATAYDSIESVDLFREAGRGFGEFQNRLSDFPAEKLSEIIPGFHDTARRYETFLAAISRDAAGRVAYLAPEIEFFRARKDMMSSIVDKIGGEIPLRVTHNDTKLNNVLIDNATGKALCVIDLDTVMPGSSLYDYGDAVRFGANTAAEDEPDLDKISLDMDLFKAFTEGFVGAAAENLTPAEIRQLPLGVMVITCELAMRFLTDYIDGDVYFKTKYPEHNLVRARAQMKLLTDIESKMEEMYAFVGQLLEH